MAELSAERFFWPLKRMSHKILVRVHPPRSSLHCFGALFSVSASSINPAASKWIWPFEILEQIGEGGMGVVYRARYVVNNRHVALKMLPADVTDQTALARFERELDVLKSLRHPNIVYCFGGSCENSRRFYAMELLEGGSLEDQLRLRGRLPWEQVVQYGLQMCAALACSHEKGVVHRDIKPSNFLINSSGHLKLSDFGLASVMASRRITASGKTAGTFLYMAPEQIRGQKITPKTDLYALGCVLYELVTGDVPFLGETPAATLHLHCSGTPPRPSEKALDCPVQLERVILQLMEKDPDKRPESAAAVAKELRSVSQTVTVVGERRPLDEPVPPRPAVKEERTVAAAGRVSSPFLPQWARLPLALFIALLLIGNAVHLVTLQNAREWKRMWVKALDHSELTVQIAAARALGEMGAGDASVVEPLAARLDHSDSRVRMAAVEALGESGASARRVMPRLLKLQNSDPNPQVRTAAVTAQQQIREARNQWRFPWLTGSLIVLGIALLGAARHYWRRLQAA